MLKLLNVDSSKSVQSERRQKYSEGQIPKLSEMISVTECAEQAALGQFLLQRIGLKSAYMSGIVMNDAQDQDEFPSKHSFVVIHLKRGSGTLIFDIARPKSNSTATNSIPRVLKTDVPLSYNLLKQIKSEGFIRATDVLGSKVKNSDEIIRTKVYYGVGDEVSGRHNILARDDFK